MEVDPGWLEVVLNRAERERGVRRVVAAACEDAVGQGDNFGSAMYRIKMDTVLGSGQPATRSLLVKNLPPPGRHRDFIEQFNAFPIEITTYSWVLSELEKLMIEKCDTNEKLWSDCLWYRPYDQIVLSDLKELGYRNIHRADRMDIEHALLTLNSLGRLHGMSAVLLHRGKLDVTRLSPYSMARNQPLMNRLLAVGLETLAAVMRQSWGSQWHSAAEKVSRLAENAGEVLQRLNAEETDKLVVFNHGDCWINNIMFRYGAWTCSPIGLRFVDFQESHFNTFGWDLTYFFHMSMSLSDMGSGQDCLIRAYRMSLLETFEKFDFTPENTPTVEDIEDELDRLLLYGFAIAAAFLPVVMDVDVGLAAEDVLDDSEASAAKRMAVYSNEKFTEVIKPMLEKCLKLGKL